MKKDKEFQFSTSWYELWMKQSKEFFESADKILKEMFAKNTFVNPEEHAKQINDWLEKMKEHWQVTQLTDEQRGYQVFWTMMARMYNDAAEAMIQEWTKRSRSGDPVKNFRELYELWLNSCHEIYQKTLNSREYQEAYGKFMNAAIKFWQATLPK